LADKARGLSDAEIGRKYRMSFRQLERLIRKAFGVSVSTLGTVRPIRTYHPKDFREETTTVWSFKSRGSWATHSGQYRGNWSPYIPRNVILKYSQPGELVLDYFCGAGTTAVEAKLLGRRCIALDINDKAIELARAHVAFELPRQQRLFEQFYEPELFVGDARDLAFLEDDSVDLICSHPPYANIIHYTERKEGDLSWLDIEQFLRQMRQVARESYRVLKPGRQCAILIGDLRRHRYVVPLGFELINVYLRAGFRLRELVIKRQHNCKTTGFWYHNSIKYNFLLLAHEYLPVFEKPLKRAPSSIKERQAPYGSIAALAKRPKFKEKLKELETTTVWIFPENKTERLVDKNVLQRYDGASYRVIDLAGKAAREPQSRGKQKDLLFIKSSCLEREGFSSSDVSPYLEKLREIVKEQMPVLKEKGYCVIQCRDVRTKEGSLEPLAKRTVDMLKTTKELRLKEIVVVASEALGPPKSEETLRITHRYLLVYKKR